MQSPSVQARGGHSPPAARSRCLLQALQNPPLCERATEGRGQGQQIGELAWRRSGLCYKPPRPGLCAALTPGPSESEPPAAALERPATVPRHQPRVAAAPAHHHGAPARRLAVAAACRPPAPRGAQPGRCEGWWLCWLWLREM